MAFLNPKTPFFSTSSSCGGGADSFSLQRSSSILLTNNGNGPGGGGFRFRACSSDYKIQNKLSQQFDVLRRNDQGDPRSTIGHDEAPTIDGLGFPHHHHPHPHSICDKLMVAVDVDEVLGCFVAALNKFIAERYSSNHSVSEYHVYEFFKIWNCSRDEADIRVHEFFKSKFFRTGIHPIPGARRILHKLSTFCNLSVVTSRQNVIKNHTIKWIEKHYPGLFQEIHFGNHFALDGISRPKSEICRSLGAEVLIDDNPRYAVECAEVGIRVLLFDYEDSYPWSKMGEHPLVTKVHNWEEVERQLAAWIRSRS